MLQQALAQAKVGLIEVKMTNPLNLWYKRARTLRHTERDVMLTDFDLQLAEHLKHALIEHHVPLYKTIVFGSRARGDAQPDPDLDLRWWTEPTVAAG